MDGNNCSSFFSSSSSGHGQVVINMKCVRAIYEKALRLLQREQSLKHTAEKPRFLDQNWFKKFLSSSYSKIFQLIFKHLSLIFRPWNWKLFEKTWYIEAEMFLKKLEIQANFKVGFLQRNDQMTT